MRDRNNKYALLTKREVKVAGYWPSSFSAFFMNPNEDEVHKNAKNIILHNQILFCVFMNPDKDEVHKNAKIYIILYSQKITPKKFAFVATKRAIPSRQDRSIFPAWVANQNTGSASSCPLAEL